MSSEIHWHRTDYESRIDTAADHLDAFVDANLATIDEPAARASREKWALACRFFAGCAAAAKAQGSTPANGGRRIAAFLAAEFPHPSDDWSTDGFDEFMDWLSNPATFHPTRLRRMLAEA